MEATQIEALREKATRIAEAMKRRETQFPGSSGVRPTWWRIEATKAKEGHSGGYARAGHRLPVLANEVLSDISDDLITEFEDAFHHPDTGPRLVRWAERAAPRAMALIPPMKRMGTFLEGVERAIEEEGFSECAP